MRPVLVISIAIILTISAAAWAAQTATITVPEAGDHYYWFTYTDIKGNPVTTTPQSFKDKKTTVDLPLVKDAVPKGTLFVLDAKSGNEAMIPISGKPGEALKFTLKAADFDRVRRIEVSVTSADEDLPAAAAIVKLVDAEKKVQTRFLDPSTYGKVEFIDVPAGTAKIIVQYGEGKSTAQDVDISLDREQPVPSIKVPVVGEIEVVRNVGIPARSTDSGDEGEEAQPQGSGRINFLSGLIGLVLLIVIVYVLIRILSNRGASVRQALKKMGVDLPEDQQTVPSAQPAPAAPVDPTICPFCGGKKDPTTGACACTVGAGSPSPTAASGASSGPRLIATQGAYAGSIFALGDDVTIGREETNAIPLPQDTTASRKHARISRADGQFTIHDEGSSNGTFVNGVRVTEQALRPGDEIQIGSTRLRFET